MQDIGGGSREKLVIYYDSHPLSLWTVISCILVLMMAVVPGEPFPRAQFLASSHPGVLCHSLLVFFDLALALTEGSSLNPLHLCQRTVPSVSWQDPAWYKHAPIPGIFCIPNC